MCPERITGEVLYFIESDIMTQYRSPAPMNFDEPKWDTWRSQFMTLRLVTKLHNEENEVQIASLKYCVGGEARGDNEDFQFDSWSE